MSRKCRSSWWRRSWRCPPTAVWEHRGGTDVQVQEVFRHAPKFMTQEVRKHVPRVQVVQVENIVGNPTSADG